MRTLLIVVVVLFSIGLSVRIAAADTPITGFRVVSDATECSQLLRNYTLTDCRTKLSGGLVLFVFDTIDCSGTCVAHFVVNGVVGDRYQSESDGERYAWSVRTNQFSPSDCVAVSITDHGVQPNVIFASRAICNVRRPSMATIYHSRGSSYRPRGTTGGVGGSSAPIPTPTPRLASNRYHRVGIQPPTGLTNTLDGQVCGQHGGSFGCPAALPAGQLILVWDYCDGCKVDGFRVYRIDNGLTKVFTTDDGDHTVAFFAPPPEGFNGKCYAVTAYIGPVESPESNRFCIGRAGTYQTVTLPLKDAMSAGRGHDSGPNALMTLGNIGMIAGTFGSASMSSPPDYPEFPYSPGHPLTVGFRYSNRESAAGDEFANVWSRTLVYFDPRPLWGKNVTNASLEMSTRDPDSCITDIAYPLSVFPPQGRYPWYLSLLATGQPFASPGILGGGNVRYDITPAMVGWTSGSIPNNGLVLYNSDENPNAFTNKACLSTYDRGSIRLVVKYLD
jgi:hypothetical protein